MTTGRRDWRDLVFLVRRFIAPYWKYSLALIGLSILAATLHSVQPLVLAPAMDASVQVRAAPARTLGEISLNNVGSTLLAALGLGSEARGMWLIGAVAILYAALAGVTALLEFGSFMLSARIGSAAYGDLQVGLFRHLMGLSMAYFVRQKTGELVSRFVGDAGETMTSLDLALRQGLQAGVQIAFYSILLFRTAPRLALMTLAVSLLHLGITRLLRDRIRRRTSDRFDALAEVGSVIQESLLSIRVIKSFAAELFEGTRFARTASDLQRLTMKYSVYKHAEAPLRGVTDAVAIGIILLLAFQTLESGGLTLSGFVLFVFIARQTIAPASAFSQSMVRLHTGLGSARRVLEILESQPDLRDGTREAVSFQRAIRLEDVSFAYQPDLPVLHDVNLEIRRGEIVAVVGPSGAGKSTLADLILRLYDPTAGRVTFDGVDVREFRQESYRRLFGVVSQECLLFNATVRDNITYGRLAPEEADVLRAARIANAEEFIAALPAGYDTLVGDRGIRLSGGQRQRIAIARAIFARPEILILDEATSSLDTESERLVQQAIDRVLENMTAVVIAHRLSTIVHADKIVVLADGGIEAVGTHAELLATSPTYRRLYELQFQCDTDLPSERSEFTTAVPSS